MKELNASDFFTVGLDAYLEPNLDLLFDLYLPIVGSKALGLYVTLLRLRGEAARSFEDLTSVSGLSIGEIDGSLSPLEAIGLLSSSRKKEEGFSSYRFLLHHPSDPRSFFTSPLLAGTLKRFAPKGYFEDMKERYVKDTSLEKGYLDVGESYLSYFRPEGSEQDYLESIRQDDKRRSSIKTGFDWNLFLSTLEGFDPRYGSLRWTAQAKRKIEGYATLYGYKEEAMAGLFDARYDFAAPVGKRIDWKSLGNDLEKAIKTKGLLREAPKARTIKDRSDVTEQFFERAKSLPPREFLSYLQNGNRVAEPDLRLLEKITAEMGLSGEVANGLVQYVLSTHDNTLPSSLVEKLAGSLVRSGITTVEDAMDYLWRTGSRKKKADDGSVPASSAPAPTEPMETPKDDSTPSKTPSEKPLSPEEEERKRYFEDFMRSTFD